MSESAGRHIPVMLDEVVAALAPRDGEIYVDGTFGAGGYTRAFLEAADCTVIAIDRDPAARARAEKMREEFGSRLIFVYGCFGDALELVRAAGFERVDGFVLDIGVSSFQIDEALRGFSFAKDGPLDMRMDTDSAGQTAADIVNGYEEGALADLLYQLGDERHSRRIARRIVQARAEKKIETTLELADLIRSVVHQSPKEKTDPATRSFQALRIAVNDELGELERGLNTAQDLLAQGGRLVVVSFHSLEDGIVKSFLYERSGRIPGGSRHLPPMPSGIASPLFTLEQRKALAPTEAESKANPRSRSAKLRWAIRTAEGGA